MRFLKISLLFFSISVFSQNNFTTPFERGNGNQSTTYEECIAFYEKLDESFANIQMIQKGTTDSGKPLYLVLFSNEGKFDFDEYFTKNKAVILINNGIHAGEPDGIDATMMLMRDLAMGKIKTAKNTLIAAIPVSSSLGLRASIMASAMSQISSALRVLPDITAPASANIAKQSLKSSSFIFSPLCCSVRPR